MHIPVEVGAGGLHHTAPLPAIRDLVEIELEDGSFRKARLEVHGLKPLQPPRPHGTRAWMQHSDHLFGDGAGPPYSAPGAQVLHQSLHPCWPIHPAVFVKMPVLSRDEDLLQEQRQVVERYSIVHIPGVLEGDRQRYTY